MRAVPYDASRQALYTPEKGAKDGETVKSIFPLSRTPSDDLVCVEASRLAYKKFEIDPKERAEIEAALATVGFSDFRPFNQKSTQAFAMWSSGRNTALVAFRGTQQDVTDLATDVDFRKTDWAPGGWVHEGFRDALNEIWPDLNAWLEQHPGKRLFTGHSLGAALATLAASLRPAEARLITIGSPRVGNADFIKTLADVAITRYVDCCDVVCRLPPEPFGFRHVAGERYIDSDGHVRIGIGEDQLKEDQLAGREDYFIHHSWRIGEVDVRDLADHAPINYVNVLLNL